MSQDYSSEKYLILKHRMFNNEVIIDVMYDEATLSMHLTKTDIQFDEISGPVFFFSGRSGEYFSIPPKYDSFYYSNEENGGASIIIKNVFSGQKYLNEFLADLLKKNPDLAGGNLKRRRRKIK